MAENILPGLSDLVEQPAYWTLWIALGLAIVAATENYGFHSSRMAAWGRKLLCQKCGTCFDSEA